MPTNENEIDRINEELKDLTEYLKKSDLRYQVILSQHSHKILLLSSASYFEKIIIEKIIEFSKKKSNSTILTSFIEKQALERKYHTLFSWKAGNINQFSQLFGKDFSEHIQKKIETDNDFKNNCKAFLSLGHLRNDLVHKNFATFTLTKTLAEIYELYSKAHTFVQVFFNELNSFKEEVQNESSV